MKRWMIAATIVVALGTAACSGNAGFRSDAQVEELDGVECLVIRNSQNNSIRAIDCNWADE